MAESPDPDRLPRRDFILIPLTALLTVMLLAGGTELVTGQFFKEARQGNCGVPDPFVSYRFAANCTYFNKAAEGPLVRYDFNDCGYRTRESCGPKPPGTLRLAVIGASTAEGFKMHYDETFASLAATRLSSLCGRRVEFQNLGIPGAHLIDSYQRVDEALKLEPDTVLLVLTPYELVDFADPERLKERKNPQPIERKGAAANPTVNESGLVARVSALLSSSSSALFAQYLLFQDRSEYIRLFLLHGDKADYLKSPLTPTWNRRLEEDDLMLGEMTEKIHAAGVPFVVLFTPQRIQAALSDPSLVPSGVDPTLIDRRLAEIAAKRGFDFIDAYGAFRRAPHAEQLFFPVDGHMRASGHAAVADALVPGLLGLGLPSFTGCGAKKAP
jgi:hypothetical protein